MSDYFRNQCPLSSEYAIYEAAIYFGTTNTSGQVMAYCPERSNLFLAKLYDGRGMEIAKTSLGRKYGSLPPAVANIRDKPGHGPDHWRGCIATSTNSAQVGYFEIMDHFKLKAAGDYQLTIHLRLYQKEQSGDLKLVDLPPVTAPVHIAWTP